MKIFTHDRDLHGLKEWIAVNNLSVDELEDALSVISLSGPHWELDGQITSSESDNFEASGSIDLALGKIIAPAFSKTILPCEEDAFNLGKEISWKPCAHGVVPHTVDNGPGSALEVCLSWQGSVSDLMCLAHEVAHAIQLKLSAGSFMPPVARETCAFLGELALIYWAKQNQTDLAARLLRVWREENQRYFGDDCALLRVALGDPESAYTYRMNYPLARAAAVVMWRAGADLQRLFKAGSEAMNLLPLAKIADVAGLSQNYLPPMPPPDTDQPAIDAYRALGAMALLDIDFWKGESERRIEGYYATLLHHLQNRTAFIALDEVRRPVGYASWRKAAGDNTVTLTRQAAPFGDHLLLQKALERHLGQGSDVQAQHPRSARQEQVAW